jgi:hypothetical protein
MLCSNHVVTSIALDTKDFAYVWFLKLVMEQMLKVEWEIKR